ncbi:MAG: hypothetical protein KKA07_02975 [Bacteroidetes bacterium]|nr:hypothetical protein [Bacteroidota bacterium]
MTNFKFLRISIVVFFFAGMISPVAAQEEKTDAITFSGFIKTDFWYDSRLIAEGREGLVLMYPLPPKTGADGKDLNAFPSYNFSAMTSRLTAKIKGPDAFGAKTSGVIEADYSGVSNTDNNGFRLRHAFVKLNWEKTELLMGNYWHPMFVTEVFPNVASLNTGAPFQPFNRSPQIAVTRKMGKFNLLAAAITQRDYPSPGPAGKIPVYLSNALVPNMHLQLQYKTEKHVAGVAGDYKFLKPRLTTATGYKTDEMLGTWAAMAYYKFKTEKFQLKVKGIYGQNLADQLLLGGYAIATVDTVRNIETYTPTNNLFCWLNVAYGKKVKAGLFAGYSMNMGTTAENTGTYYATGADIAYMYRIAPNVTVKSGNFEWISEVEYTAAAFGMPDIKGVVQNAELTANYRLLFTVLYYF